MGTFAPKGTRQAAFQRRGASPVSGGLGRPGGSRAGEASNDRWRGPWPADPAAPWAGFTRGWFGPAPRAQVWRKAATSAPVATEPPAAGASGLTVSNASDPSELEADAMAEKALATPRLGTGIVRPASPGADRIDRQCASCEEDDEHGGSDPEPSAEHVHRRGNEAPVLAPKVAAEIGALRGRGRSLPDGERDFFEQRFGYELSGVRIHDDARASEAARALRAEAFTVRSDVAFRAGRYQPGSDAGRRLLAHELAHVIQQGEAAPLGSGPSSSSPAVSARAGARVARREDDSAAAPAATEGPAASTAATAESAADAASGGGLIVEDEAQVLTTGQARKTAFLTDLRVQVCAAADQALARAGRDTRGCPYVEKWLGHYAGRPASHLERAIRKFVPGGADVTSASGYIPLVARRMVAGVDTWVATGKIPNDIPAELREELPGAGMGGAVSAMAGAVGGGLSSIGSLLFKDAPGGSRRGADREALSMRLGPGRPLESAARTRMETALGAPLGSVRIHDDPRGAALSRDLNARAFALGEHVAFAHGAYRPGTPVGDALLAHELAHVAQQNGAPPDGPGLDTRHDQAFEHDADRAAEGAMVALYAPARATGDKRPRLRGGLRLSRCNGLFSSADKDAEAGPPAADQATELKAVFDEIGNPSRYKADLVTHIGKLKGAATKILDGMTREELEALAGSPDGVEVLKAIRAELDPTGQPPKRIDDALDVRGSSPTSVTLAKATPADQAAIDKINLAINADPNKPEYAKTTPPLVFPVPIYTAGRAVDGGVYYDPNLSEAGKTLAPVFFSPGQKRRYPIVYIKLGPDAVSLDASYIQSTLWHEFQHFKQYISFRLETNEKSESTRLLEEEAADLQGNDKPASAEVEATSIQIASYLNMGDEGMKSSLRYLGRYLPDALPTFRDAAIGRIVDAVKAAGPKQKARLLKLLDDIKDKKRHKALEPLRAAIANAK